MSLRTTFNIAQIGRRTFLATNRAPQPWWHIYLLPKRMVSSNMKNNFPYSTNNATLGHFKLPMIKNEPMV